jgi:preprotein translocase subunit SecG
LFYLVVTIHVLVCLLIIAVVLLQAGKGADIGSAFGGSGSQAVFGSMGTPTLLGKVTAGVAIAFMLTSFWLASHGGKTGTTIMPATESSAPAPAAPATPAPAPAAAPGPPPAAAPSPAPAPAPAGQR